MIVEVAKTEEQIQEVFNIRKMVFVEEQQVPLEEEIDGFEKASTHFVLYDQGQAAGAGRFRILDGAGKVERICILRDLRGKGAGRALMLAIEDHAREQGLSTLKLNAQTYAIPFYTGLGYDVSSKEFLDAGIPHKSMIKHI
ncbi:GNAT family N-acetyltransferase [Bacillus sp. KH172YL63]|uniref:GNAT family N-acetyltransferase n=1 Tax=Bacillus sp. KH172YL63 TaxID=2709784 RepID=UPI0013E4EDBA|nr:GNAT family N-acetyltransferase [Bacillus sp. KH172YL63]BCB03075.1 N-acetyltransferase [Bacillus sp. KH172YL63]